MNYYEQMVDSLDDQIWRYTVRRRFHVYCFIIYDILIVGVAFALLISFGAPLWALLVQSALGFCMTAWNGWHAVLYDGAIQHTRQTRLIAWTQAVMERQGLQPVTEEGR